MHAQRVALAMPLALHAHSKFAHARVRDAATHTCTYMAQARCAFLLAATPRVAMGDQWALQQASRDLDDLEKSLAPPPTPTPDEDADGADEAPPAPQTKRARVHMEAPWRLVDRDASASAPKGYAMQPRIGMPKPANKLAGLGKGNEKASYATSYAMPASSKARKSPVQPKGPPPPWATQAARRPQPPTLDGLKI